MPDNLCMMIFYLVPAGKAREDIPAPLKAAEVLPGFTVGGLYAARYGRQGDALVNEFGLLQAYASYGDRKGFLLKHWVMDSSSEGCAGGEFSWRIEKNAVSLDVASEGVPLVAIRMRPIVSDVPVNTNFPFICMKGGSAAFFRNHFVSRLGIATTKVVIPDGSPLLGSHLGFKLVSTFWDASNVVLKEAAEFVPKGALKADKAFGSPIGKST